MYNIIIVNIQEANMKIKTGKLLVAVAATAALVTSLVKDKKDREKKDNE